MIIWQSGQNRAIKQKKELTIIVPNGIIILNNYKELHLHELVINGHKIKL